MTEEQYQESYEAIKDDPRFTNVVYEKFLEDDKETCDYDSHYVLHTAWAARVLAETKPQRHVDIGSSLYFVSITSAFVPIDFYEYRTTPLPLDQVSSSYADLKKLPFLDKTISSLSCLHTLEHIGLGRYGDEPDQGGDVKAARELYRVLADGGNLLVAMPVGLPTLVFNAHRIYSYGQVLALFPYLTLTEFALIPDEGRQLLRHCPPDKVQNQKYACGCFWFKKI